MTCYGKFDGLETAEKNESSDTAETSQGRCGRDVAWRASSLQTLKKNAATHLQCVYSKRQIINSLENKPRQYIATD